MQRLPPSSKMLDPRFLSFPPTLRQPLIPTHLLHQAISSPSWSQRRSFSSLFPLPRPGLRKFSNSSTLLSKRLRYDAFRYVHNQPYWRCSPAAQPENVPAMSEETWEQFRQRKSHERADSPTLKSASLRFRYFVTSCDDDGRKMPLALIHLPQAHRPLVYRHLTYEPPG